MKRIIIGECREAVIIFIQKTLLLTGESNVEVIANTDDIKSLDNNTSVLIDIVENLKIKEQIHLINPNVKIIFYQVANNEVVRFWNEGFINQIPTITTLSSPNQTNAMFIRTRGRLEKLDKQNILYIESDKKYCTIITTTKKYVLRTALKNLYEQLKGNDFIRIHRSYLINKRHITQIDTQQQNILIGEKEISIGRHYQENLFNEISILQ